VIIEEKQGQALGTDRFFPKYQNGYFSQFNFYKSRTIVVYELPLLLESEMMTDMFEMEELKSCTAISIATVCSLPMREFRLVTAPMRTVTAPVDGRVEQHKEKKRKGRVVMDIRVA